MSTQVIFIHHEIVTLQGGLEMGCQKLRTSLSKIPKVGISSKAAYQLLHNETALDSNPLLNLAL